jgi:hypothetical protein
VVHEHVLGGVVGEHRGEPMACYQVGGIPTPLKNMKVSWDSYSQYMGK